MDVLCHNSYHTQLGYSLPPDKYIGFSTPLSGNARAIPFALKGLADQTDECNASDEE
jgi:hypothetical protein